MRAFIAVLLVALAIASAKAYYTHHYRPRCRWPYEVPTGEICGGWAGRRCSYGRCSAYDVCCDYEGPCCVYRYGKKKSYYG